MAKRPQLIFSTEQSALADDRSSLAVGHAPLQPVVPVLRPKLPSAAALAPYLLAIDQRQSYSNFGPLCTKVQSELARHLGCAPDRLSMASSGTSGLTAALLALGLPSNAVCIMPAWTFAATPHAAMSAGFKPFFMDVDKGTWALDPPTVKRALTEIPERVGAVMVVSPFGAPIDIRAWESFQTETGIPVIVDAAAGFDTARASNLISVVSLHATKVFASGEGGMIICPSAEMRNRIQACSNFGFHGSRIAGHRAINSKMSEYHAAVALANLDCWPATRCKHLEIIRAYKRALSGVPHLTLQPGYGTGWVCGTTNVVLESDSAESISQYLQREGIETRAWWGAGCHVHPAFSACERGDLAATGHLGMRVLGLPHFSEMKRTDILHVTSTLLKALSSRASGRRPPQANQPKL